MSGFTAAVTAVATYSARMDGNVSGMRAVTLLVVLAIAVSPSSGLTKPTGVKLQNNEYTGIVVAIHPDEPENPAIIDIIKEMFTNASSYLYTATRKRAFFKNVTILIPETWSDNRVYKSPGNATFRGADVIVAAHNPRFAPDGPRYALPYTKQFTGCGEQSLYIHLTSEFLLGYERLQRVVGNYGRILVHEWGHYRWGLFNEHADKLRDLGRANYFYYSETNQVWEHTSCSKGWSMKYLKRTRDKCRECNGNPYDGYEDGCFAAAFSRQPEITGSIMQYVVPNDVINFCDNEAHNPSYLHNSEAPSRQNRFCDGKSSWEVMREHIDFNGDVNNPPREIADVTPTFHVARARPLRVVFVLDTSGSMSTANRHLVLADAARTCIQSFLPDGSLVGLVDFDDVGKIVSQLTEITSMAVRRNLASLVPLDANGGTCIGCGMQTAMGVLKSYNSDVGGSKVILITDGADSNHALINTMMMEYIANGVTIDSIAITDAASDIIVNLAENTGGKFYLQTDDRKSQGIYRALLDLYSTGNTREYDRRIELQSGVESFSVGDTEIRKSVHIDSTLGRSTVFEFGYVTTDVGIDVLLTSPSGMNIDRQSSQYQTDEEFKKVKIEINGIAEPGSWRYILQNRVRGEEHFVKTSVSSYPSQHSVAPILVESFLSSSKLVDKPLVAYAEVRQGFYPIVNATVLAVIETPAGTTVELPLLDNGAGSDVTKEDGIYSRYFTQFNGSGYYGFKLQISNEGEAKVITPRSWGQSNDISCQTDGDVFLILGNSNGDPKGDAVTKFIRDESPGATHCTLPVNVSSNVDNIPPGKITDLVVSSTSYTDGNVVIRFTAPGDDLDFGSANRYVIHFSNTSLRHRDQSKFIGEITEADIIYGSISSPASFGNEENIAFRITFPKDMPTVSYIISVYAIDEADNAGEKSNPAQAAFRKNIPPPLEDYWEKSLDTAINGMVKFLKDHPKTSLIGIVALLLMSSCFIIGGLRRRRKE